MLIELRPIDQIIPYENNPRLNDAAVDAVARSLKEFGFRQPIVVDKDNVIVVGHIAPTRVCREVTGNACYILLHLLQRRSGACSPPPTVTVVFPPGGTPAGSRLLGHV